MAHSKVWMKVVVGIIAVAILTLVKPINPIATLVAAVFIMFVGFDVKFFFNFLKPVEKPQDFLGANEVGGYGEGQLKR